MNGRKAAGYKEGIVSILINTILFIIKYLVGIMFNSIAMISESVHTLSDSLTSIIVLISFWLAYRPADEQHPFGHGRVESIGSIIIAILLLITAYELIVESIKRYLNHELIIFSWSLVAILIISAIIKEILARWSLNLGTVYNSKTLVGDAWHHRTDAIASIIVGIGIIFSNYYWWLDSVLGVCVSSFIGFIAIKLLIETSKDIIGYKLPSEVETEVKNVISSVSKDISDVHHIHAHKYEEHVEITLHIRLPPNMSLSDAHKIASKVEEELKRLYGWNVTVHVEPYIESKKD